jgi:hypothetical protein
MGMEPKDGCLTVLDLYEVSTVAFTSQGVENLEHDCFKLKRSCSSTTVAFCALCSEPQPQ